MGVKMAAAQYRRRGPEKVAGTSLPPFYAPGTTSFYTSSSTQYQNAGGSGAETTTYSYTFFPDNEATGAAIETETTALPAVPTADGGTGSSPTSTDVYNSLGQLVWSQDANGSISYTAYDPATGAVNEQIRADPGRELRRELQRRQYPVR